MNTSQISIVVPVYNVANYLHRCVDSLLAQTFQDYEILLIDDGSLDGSGQICDEYARLDCRIKAVHKSNGGVSSARNEGLKRASGKWIVFVDSDDYVSSDYLLNFGFDKLTADIYLQGYKIELGDKILDKRFYSIQKNGFYSINQLLLEGESNNLLNSPWCKMFDINIIKKYDVRFDTNISYGEDHLFVLEYLSYVQTVAVSPAMSYNYVLCNDSSLTKRSVPYQELLYYITKARGLQTNLLGERFFSSIEAEIIWNKRAYWIFVQSLQSLFGKDVSLSSYKIFKQKFSPIEFGYSGLAMKQKLLLYLFLKIPTYFSYFVFKLLI